MNVEGSVGCGLKEGSRWNVNAQAAGLHLRLVAAQLRPPSPPLLFLPCPSPRTALFQLHTCTRRLGNREQRRGCHSCVIVYLQPCLASDCLPASVNVQEDPEPAKKQPHGRKRKLGAGVTSSADKPTLPHSRPAKAQACVPSATDNWQGCLQAGMFV